MSVRHTSSLVLRALFDTLGDINGKRFLDLFAGDGRVGKEALSRGAREVFFVEINSSMVREICRTVKREKVLKMDYKKALQKLRSMGKKFDIIFADPPYERGFVGEILRVLEELPLLERGGLLIIERSYRERFELGKWELLKERKYGDTILSYFREG